MTVIKSSKASRLTAQLVRFRKVYNGIFERNLEVMLTRLHIRCGGPRRSITEPLGRRVYHALYDEGLKYVGNTLRTEEGWAVRHLEMQVRPIGIPGVS